MASWIEEKHSPAKVFGELPERMEFRLRLAAYVFASNDSGQVAVIQVNVRGPDEYWLPGGGAWAGESPEDTAHREILEESGCGVSLLGRVGEAVQFFYAGDDQCWYRMEAVFFEGKFFGETNGKGEHDIKWIDPIEENLVFFHECHAWFARHL